MKIEVREFKSEMGSISGVVKISYERQVVMGYMGKSEQEVLEGYLLEHALEDIAYAIEHRNEVDND